MAIIPADQLVAPGIPGTAKQRYTPALFALGILYFMMGFITCLNDSLVPFFKQGFTLTYAQSSLVQFYFFLTYGLLSIPAGKLVERTGYKKGMVLGFAIAAAGALLFFPAASFHLYPLFLAALFTIAMGIVLLQVAANPYITVLGPAATASSRLALIQGIGSVGTTVAPLFGAGFILSRLRESTASSDAVKYPYLGIAAVLLLIAAVLSRLPLPVVQRQHHRADTTGKKQTAFNFRQLRLGIPGIFTYVGAEVAIGTFLTNYTADLLHITEEKANQYVAFYWGGMLVGRLLGAGLLRFVKTQTLLSGCAIAAVLLLLVSINTSGTIAVWSMIATGLCNSVMFASIFSLAVKGLGRHTMQASGYLATAIAGGAIIPFVSGVLKDHYNWQLAFLVPLICYLYILFYGINGYKITQHSKP